MQPSGGQSTLAVLLAEQRELEERVHRLEPCAEAALMIGYYVLAFAAREDEAFAALAPLLDPAARQELAADHHQIAEDLALLEWLLSNGTDSPDIAVLTSSLIRRMRQHVDRDGRLLARAAGMLGTRRPT
ncbi:MAG TPA: hypothetical protein VJ813_14295 [Vicinamibacterales bacterium]|nr:hypothetical protein [Vicinamibacterales bacterium]